MSEVITLLKHLKNYEALKSSKIDLRIFSVCYMHSMLMLQTSPTLKDTGLFACSCLILGADEGREDEFD